MKRVYLDNGATSYPKAPGVGDRMKHFIEDIGCSVNRSGYESDFSTEEVVFETREIIAGMFNFDLPENVVFTLNVTQALNFLIKGILDAGDHCIVSSMEHNAVMRPLMQLSRMGVEFTRIQCDEFGRMDADSIRSHIKNNTKAVIVTHASNVCGTVLPVQEIGNICRQNGLKLIIDTAQTAGILDIDFMKLNADAIAFTGHKGLLGPHGIGGFLISKELASAVQSLISGGTGSLSEFEEQPPYMPDKFEAGTPNLPGIFGLNTALKYINKVGIKGIREKEMELTGLFLNGIGNITGIETVGLRETAGRTAVISIDFVGKDNANIAYLLERDYGIKTRCGMHCAPSAHKTLGTFPRGTVRFSLGHFNTKEEIEYTVDAINRVLKG
ncbi:MAG: Cysteine desulfurase [Firmicutes bacterium]|nr:Cysteine desulfurase [Bacillota bacterium]MDI6705733.1 aminotransferase class V-fold PLP-dependent enzyme [Bacillota bacterium]